PGPLSASATTPAVVDSIAVLNGAVRVALNAGSSVAGRRDVPENVVACRAGRLPAVAPRKAAVRPFPRFPPPVPYGPALHPPHARQPPPEPGVARRWPLRGRAETRRSAGAGPSRGRSHGAIHALAEVRWRRRQWGAVRRGGSGDEPTAVSSLRG